MAGLLHLQKTAAWGCIAFFLVALPFDTVRGEGPFKPLLKSFVEDVRPRFEVDPELPWHILLWRGGMGGAESVRIESSGKVDIHRWGRGKDGAGRFPNETARIIFPTEAIADVLNSIHENDVLGMHFSYSAGAVDGTQWYVLVSQGDHHKTIEFDNYFSDEILSFAEKVDELLEVHGLERTKWETVNVKARPSEHPHELELSETHHNLLYLGKRLQGAVEDARPRFEIDPAQPWHIVLCRGGFLGGGFDTVRIDCYGDAELYRVTTVEKKRTITYGREKTKLVLPPKAVEELRQAIDTNGVLKMYRIYNADVEDGTQWKLLVKQGEHCKTIYCNNYFPDELVAFSKALDREIEKHGLKSAKWEAAERGPLIQNEHEKEFAEENAK